MCARSGEQQQEKHLIFDCGLVLSSRSFSACSTQKRGKKWNSKRRGQSRSQEKHRQHP